MVCASGTDGVREGIELVWDQSSPARARHTHHVMEMCWVMEAATCTVGVCGMCGMCGMYGMCRVWMSSYRAGALGGYFEE